MNRVEPSIVTCIALVSVAACADPPPVEEPPLDPVLEVHVDAIDLGAVSCGKQGTTSFAVTNPSGGRLEAAILSTLPGVTVSPDRVEVGPFQTATIEVTAAVPSIATPGFVSRGDIVIGGNGGSLRLPVSFSAAGAVVTFDRSTVDFGETVTRSFVTRDLTASVAGTAGATITLGPSSSGSFVMIGTSTATLAANASHTFRMRMSTGANEETLAATLPIEISGDLCAPPPEAVDLAGVATNDLLTISTTTIDFGSAPCSVFSTAEIEMTNHGQDLVRFDIVRTDPHGFIGGFLDGVVPAGETDTTTVRHARVPYDLDLPIGTYSARLDVNLHEAVTKTIPVFTSIDRPILTLSTTDIDAGSGTIGTFERTFMITNDGNRPDDILLEALADRPGTIVELSPQAFQLESGRSQVVTARVTATSADRLLVNVFVHGRCESDTVLIATDL